MMIHIWFSDKSMMNMKWNIKILCHTKKMVNNFKQYFNVILFEKIPQVHNKVVDAMATIRSLLKIPNNVHQCEFLVENILIPTFDVLESKLVCEIFGPNSPWYKDFYNYLHNQILPPDFSNNQ